MSYLENLFDIKNKTIVVTGAAGQLGKEICGAFNSAGAKVVGLDLKKPDLPVDGVEYKIMDITDKAQILATFKDIAESFTGIDVLVNNAGVNTFDPPEERSEEDFDWIYNVNLKGTFLCIQAYINLFDEMKFKSGSIVNIGSIFGLVSPDFRNYTDCQRMNSEVYGATKAGVIQMTKYFSVYLASRNIRVNAVSPGGVFNPQSPQGEDFVKNYSSRCPMNRMANDKDISGAILYLASAAAEYTTGQNITIDGGTTSW